MMKFKIFNHPKFKNFANRYKVSPTGKVINLRSGKELTLHQMQSKSSFVRLCGIGVNLSITIDKLILLTYKPNGYENGKISVKKEYNKPVSLNNLFWGTRKDQTEVQMKNPEHKNRVFQMARKFHGTEDKEKSIKLLVESGITKNITIAKMLNVSEATVYFRKKSLGITTSFGDINYSRKLTWKKALKIRKIKENKGITNKNLAHKFGVSEKQISRIIRNENWITKL